MSSLLKRITGNSSFRLDRQDTADTLGLDKEKAEAALEKLREKLFSLQTLLYAENKRSVLVVLQGLDASGKDGTIRRVFSGVNPQGCQVTSFKAPSSEELEHDFLWRIHKRLPAKGMIGIFNRSHYEDVLIARVHGLVPEEVWSRRYEQINQFEKTLADTGTVLLKFFLHVGKDEQKKRLETRLKDPSKMWKHNPDDAKERKYWDAYQEAYQAAIRKCHTAWAPWYVVPSDRKWVRNLAIAEAVVTTMEGLRMKWPKAKR